MTTDDFMPFNRMAFNSPHAFNRDVAGSNPAVSGNWPPYDMIRAGAGGFRLVFAVPGFSTQELSVTFQPNLLTVAGAKAGEDKAQYLYQGIAESAFTRQFELPNYVEVRNASLDNGLLKIDLVREIPEAARPRKIEIASSPAENPALSGEESEAVANGKAAA